MEGTANVVAASVTTGEKEKEKQHNAKAKATKRAEGKSHMSLKDAMKSMDVVTGALKVLDLNETVDRIGPMNEVCKFCGAVRFRHETPGSCCGNGKVVLEPFPKPPDVIMDLLKSESEEGKVFRKYARSINNAVCLSSIQVNERRGGWQPSVILQGKAIHRVGPLLQEEGEQPRFVQLYVNDPSLETTNRFQNMVLPSTVTAQEKQYLAAILETVQGAIHQHNPFIQDFKQIMEIPDSELQEMKIVISASQRPQGEHERRYNTQTNLKEVSILTNSEKHDIVLHKRGGGL